MMVMMQYLLTPICYVNKPKQYRGLNHCSTQHPQPYPLTTLSSSNIQFVASEISSKKNKTHLYTQIGYKTKSESQRHAKYVVACNVQICNFCLPSNPNSHTYIYFYVEDNISSYSLINRKITYQSDNSRFVLSLTSQLDTIKKNSLKNRKKNYSLSLIIHIQII